MKNIEIALLGFVYENPVYGYDMYKSISDPDGFGAIYHLKIGRLYSILNKLEKTGYVQSNIDASGARPPKKIFSITPQGKNKFLEWLNNPVKHGREIRINLLVKMYFAEKLHFVSIKEIADRQIAECENWLFEINQSNPEKQNTQTTQALVREFRISQINSYITWLNTCKRRRKND